jgi:hypothetical protein
VKLNPNFLYCAGDFKDRWHADFGAASTHGGHHCTDCRHIEANGERCGHPRLFSSFSLGTYPDRMGCRNAFEPKEGADA